MKTDTQALITRRSGVSVRIIGGTPSEETLRHLRASGFTYDPRSRQWYRSHNDEAIHAESEILSLA